MNDDSKQRDIPKAIALKWDGDAAPKVTAKGEGDIAEKILSIARKHNIPIQEDNEVLINALAQIDLGDEIPEMLYLAVAQVIAFAYYLSGKQPATHETG